MEEGVLRIGIEATKFEAVCHYVYGGKSITEYLGGPPATISEAEILFHILGSLSSDERQNLREVTVSQVEYETPYSIEFMPEKMKMYEFITSIYGAGVDPEICPGCGIFLGGDINPMCEHPDGCGKMRQIPLANPEDRYNKEEDNGNC